MPELRIVVDGVGRQGSSAQAIGYLRVGRWDLTYDLVAPQVITPSNRFWTIVRFDSNEEAVRSAGGRAVRITLSGAGNRRDVAVDVGGETGFQMAAYEADIPIASHGTVAANFEITGWLFRAPQRSFAAAGGGGPEEDEMMP